MEKQMPKHAWMFAACIVATLIGAAPAPAQTPDALAAAKDLMVTMKSADQFRTIMPSLMNALKPAIVQNRPEVERDYDALMPLMTEAMNARVNDVLDKVAAIYARNFTVAELNEITAFYRGPTGQKFIQRLPGVMQESMAAGQQFGQAIAAELRSRMIEELRKKGHNI
jgi:hypothetical protein